MPNKNIITGALRLIKQCPSCQTKYTQSQAKILDFTKTGALIYFSCPTCSSSLVAKILETPFGVVGSAMLTEFEPREVLKFQNLAAINIDDLLKLHQSLEKK